ncbi:MAG: DUF4172 domain-containing protein [Gammaproteobacteria bacterium]|nr:DUF4172 domain-containing protein [Gammaproteobacteria bacterium]
MTHWIWSNKSWPKFTWDVEALSLGLSAARLARVGC